MRRAELEALVGAAFALGFILLCAQRCLSSSDSFLRAAALIRRRRLDALATRDGPPVLRPLELRD
jgi:hypothetical protein